MSLNNLISGGGKVLVVGGMAKAWESYRKFDQLEFWSGEQKEIVRTLRDKPVPANCKAIIISRFISHSELSKVMSQARQRGITMFPNKNDGEIASLLDEITSDAKPTVIEEKVETTKKVEGAPTKGKLLPLLPYVDFSKTAAENARTLLMKAKELGIETTLGSLSQWILTIRRKRHGQTAVVKSIKPKLDLSVDMLDSMIKDLSGMRDFLIAVTEENRILKSKVEKFKKAFEDI